jgi:MFS family permease
MDWKKLLPLYIGAGIGPIGGFGIVPIIPVLANSWSVPFTTASLAITFYMAPFICIQIFSGSIAQVYDVRKTLFFGFAVYSLGGVLCGLSPNLWALLASRVVQGTGGAFLTPVIMAMIGELVSEQHVGKAMGLLGLAYTVGVTMGPLISGMIDVYVGWPWFFFSLAALSLAAGVLYLASSESARRETAQGQGVLAILPILKEALFQPGVFYLSLSAFSYFITYIGIGTFTADHLKTHLHLPSDRIGAMISVTGFSGMICSPIAGYLGDRYGRTNIFLMGVGIALLSVVLMTFVTYSYFRYLLFFLILGAGSAIAWTSLNTIAVQMFPPLRKPVTSVYNAIKFSGYAFSPVILSFLYAPFRLEGVQMGCMGAILVSALLGIIARSKSKKETK